MSTQHEAAVASRRNPPFQRALQQYLKELDEKTKAKDFFAQFCGQDAPADPEDVNRALKGKVDERWSKPSTTAEILQTLAKIQMNYDGVVNSLIAFDPTPISNVVWTCIGALAKTIDGYFKVPEKIAHALLDLGNDLTSIETYSRLFGRSPKLEDVFTQSYLDIFRFWGKVYQELLHTKARRFIASLSLRADKFSTIIADMNKNAGRVQKQIQVVREERVFEEKQEQAIRTFLGTPIPLGSIPVIDGRMSRYERSQLEEQCCEWISEEPKYRTWLKGETMPPAMWVHGPPGSGKSTLCRRVAQSIRTKEPSAAVASHFFRFDQNYSAIDVLKSIVAQLWEQWVLQHFSSPVLDKLARFTAEGVKGQEPIGQVMFILHALVEELPTTYLFLDGVDEELRKDAQTNALEVLDLVDHLITDLGERSSIHVWISSQDVRDTQEKFKAYSPFNIKDAVKSGIRHYLSRTIGNLTAVPSDRRDSIIQELTGRAESNFLWAHLMVIELQKAITPAEMDEVLEDGRVDDLDKYYRRFFSRRMGTTKDSISRDVFSLVTFSRWPLTVGEIQEAVAVLRSGPGCLNNSQKPFLPDLFELFSPLIEVQHDNADTDSIEEFVKNAPFPPPIEVQHDNADSDSVEEFVQSGPTVECDQRDDSLKKTCRLFHSTLFDFLQRHADLFYEEGKVPGINQRNESLEFRTCQLRIAEACLLYLSQTKYSQLLRRQEDKWVDADNHTVSEHYFLIYSAKNWDKHLDLVAPDGSDFVCPSYERTEDAIVAVERQFRPRVQDFLNSSNYQTCLQILSIWDGATFLLCRQIDHTPSFRRALPRWIGYSKDYRRFWMEWNQFLGYPTFTSIKDCLKSVGGRPTMLIDYSWWAAIDSDNPKLYKGEIDRCWWASLGSKNFLSTLKSRYRCFHFQLTTQPEDGDTETADDPILQATVVTHDCVKTLWLRPSATHNGHLHFFLEVWKYGIDKLPVLARTQTLLVDGTACKASLYSTLGRLDCGNKIFSVSGEGGRAPLASFNEDGRCLRIGTQVYIVDTTGEYRIFAGITARKEPYIEEIAAHGVDDVVAVTSRKTAPITISRVSCRGTGREAHGHQASRDRKSGWTRIMVDGDISDSSSEYNDGEYESWSECSSSQLDPGSAEEVESESDSDHTPSEFASAQREEDELEDTDSESDNGPVVYADEESSTDEDSVSGFQNIDDAVHSEPEEEEDSEYADTDIDNLVDPSLSVGVQIRTLYSSEDHEERTNDEDDSDKAKTSIWIVQNQRFSMRIFTPEGKLFQFIDFIIPTMHTGTSTTPPQLSNCPASFHPTQPLVVWPLSGWRVLFADYEDRTYFIRELGTPSDASNLLMRCHFAGQYLYVASFEGRTSKDSPDYIPYGPPPIIVDITVYTYRLCSQKPTRAPPSLIHVHRVGVSNRIEERLLQPKLPYTLTWTTNYLYITRSSSPTLQVYKIPLYRHQEQSDEPKSPRDLGTLYPGEALPMPASTVTREVFFFPLEEDSLARIIAGEVIMRKLGATARGDIAAPIGCILNIDSDMGGWTTEPTETKVHNLPDASQEGYDVMKGKSDHGATCVLEPL